MGGERRGDGKSTGGDRRGDGKSMGGERRRGRQVYGRGEKRGRQVYGRGEKRGGGKRDLLSGRRQERWKIYRPSETRQTIEGQDKRPFLSFFRRFQIELC